MKTSLMLRALRHDIWATEKLIAHLRTLQREQLDLTVPGTYGSIGKTLTHLVRGDERYLVRLGVDMGTPLPANESSNLDEVAAHLGRVKTEVEKLFAASRFDPDGIVHDTLRANPKDPPLAMEAWTMLVQFTHHGSDHRAHIGTILGAHGLPTPNLDVWAYGSETGAIREKKP